MGKESQLKRIQSVQLPPSVRAIINSTFKRLKENPNEREGQALFNTLFEYEPRFADSIRGTNNDPFHDDSIIDSCLEYFHYWRTKNGSREGLEEKKSLLPRVVYQMCVHGALIVGSYAKFLMGEDVETNDFDLLVPLEKWQTIALLIPETAKPNKFGGWRFEDEKGNEIDVWPDTMHNYLKNCKTKYGGKVYAVDYIANKAYCSMFISK